MAQPQVDHADLRSVAVGNDDLIPLLDQADQSLGRLRHLFPLLRGGVAQRVPAQGHDNPCHICLLKSDGDVCFIISHSGDHFHILSAFVS